MMKWEGFTPVIPGNPKVKELVNHRERTVSIYSLEKPPKGVCIWCFKNPNPTYRHTYCSEECKFSCYLFCYPQVYGPGYLKALYGNKCNSCSRGFDEGHLNKQGMSLGHEVDHIIPIFKGGTALGWDNIQLLCQDCHRLKSAQERRR